MIKSNKNICLICVTVIGYGITISGDLMELYFFLYVLEIVISYSVPLYFAAMIVSFVFNYIYRKLLKFYVEKLYNELYLPYIVWKEFTRGDIATSIFTVIYIPLLYFILLYAALLVNNIDTVQELDGAKLEIPSIAYLIFSPIRYYVY